jgi:hypothetical protein
VTDQEKPKPESVLVFRNELNEPIAVPGDVVMAAERAYRCHLARVGGQSWEEIAIAEKYPSAAAASHDVTRYLKEGAAMVTEASAQEQLAQEVRRLDALQYALWAQAMGGMVPAVNAIVNIINHRARLIGLDPDKMDTSGPVTVVVPPDAASYMAALKKAAGALPAATTTP